MEDKKTMIKELKLMNAANDYTMNIRKGYPRAMDETDIFISNAFTAGAQWAFKNNTETNTTVIYQDEKTEEAIFKQENVTLIPNVGDIVEIEDFTYRVIQKNIYSKRG